MKYTRITPFGEYQFRNYNTRSCIYFVIPWTFFPWYHINHYVLSSTERLLKSILRNLLNLEIYSQKFIKQMLLQVSYRNIVTKTDTLKTRYVNFIKHYDNLINFIIIIIKY